MNLKTDNYYYEENFVQNGEEMRELTITITLGEYRSLIQRNTTQKETIEKLQEENKELNNQVKIYIDFICANHREITENLLNPMDRPLKKEGRGGEMKRYVLLAYVRYQYYIVKNNNELTFHWKKVAESDDSNELLKMIPPEKREDFKIVDRKDIKCEVT